MRESGLNKRLLEEEKLQGVKVNLSSSEEYGKKDYYENKANNKVDKRKLLNSDDSDEEIIPIRTDRVTRNNGTAKVTNYEEIDYGDSDDSESSFNI